MKRYGIERQTLFITLAPILVMAILLESYFVFTRFADLERSLLERSQLLARQLASASEYSVFSGNSILLKQNVDAALSFADVVYVGVYDAKSRLLMEAGVRVRGAAATTRDASATVDETGENLRLFEPILATEINLDGLMAAPASAERLGSVVIEISRKNLNSQKQQFLLVSLLVSLLVFTVALVLALRTARRITWPVLQMHKAVKRIGEGDLESEVASSSNIRELQELADGIGEMAKHLLRDRDMLENRIVETTDGLRVKSMEVEQVNLQNQQLNENLALALRDMQAIMEANPDLLYVFNKNGELVQWNSSFARFFALTPEQLRGRHLSTFISEEERAEASRRMLDVFYNESIAMEVQLLRHDGAKVPYFCNAVVLRNQHGEVTGFTGTGRDISDRKSAIEQMHRMAHYDLLTGLPNRSLMSERLNQALIISQRKRLFMAVMFLDLDMFKFINDKLGHDVGDLLLKEAARRIQECVRDSDTAARIGGDEFVVILPGIETIEVAQMVAEKIRHAISQPFDIAGNNLSISTSIGIAICPDHGSEEKHLLKNADTAMYLAKRKGRNAVVFYTS